MDCLIRTEDLVRSVDSLADSPVLVVGDVMLDVYLEGDADRISPEAPVPVVRFRQERNMLGGAGNVARNISVLGGNPCLLGLIGNERAADLLEDDVRHCGFAAHLLRSRRRMTTVKTRILAQGQQVLRLDKECFLEPDARELGSLFQKLEYLLPQYPVLVLSDYAKGLMSLPFWQGLAELVRNCPQPPKIIVDPKPGHIEWYRGVSWLTPNRKELSFMAHMPVDSRDELVQAGLAVLRRTRCRGLLVTLADEGMALFTGAGNVWNIPTVASKVFDVTGAGDTVISVLAQSLAAGLPLLHAALLANYAAGEVIRHVGVAAVDRETLKDIAARSPLPEIQRWK